MSSDQTRVVIVYHSGYGHTEAQAAVVCDGAAGVDDTRAELVPVDRIDAAWELLDAADAIVFGSPTYTAGPTAPFKAFMDATSGRWAQQAWRDKLAAGFTNSSGASGDRLNTLESFALFAMQHSMVWVGLRLLPGNITTDGSPEDLNRLAGFLGAMAQSNVDVGPQEGPSASDRRTAAHLGRRVAEIAARWRLGSPPVPAVGVGAVSA